MTTKPYRKPWTETGQEAVRVASAAALIRFAFQSPTVIVQHRNRVISDLLWAVTEDEGKYSTRYRSRGALDLDEPDWRRFLRHEHVVTRKELRAALTREAAEERGALEAILSRATACIVTVEEHARISQFDRTLSGWDRYEAAGVEVIDMATGNVLIPGQDS